MTKSKVYLLDSNVLIALATPEHSLNSRAAAYFKKGYRFATSPITQGSLIRFHLRAGVEATAESAKASARIHFQPLAGPVLAGPCFLRGHASTAGITGHRQVTDAYLVLLARKHGGSLATMDRALAAVHAGTTLVA